MEAKVSKAVTTIIEAAREEGKDPVDAILNKAAEYVENAKAQADTEEAVWLDPGNSQYRTDLAAMLKE